MSVKHSIVAASTMLVVLTACVNPCEQRVYTPDSLFAYIETGKTEKAKARYEQGESVYDECLGSLYHAAARTENQGTINFVKSLPIDLEYENSSGYTAVFVASGELLQYLIEKGADIHHVAKDGKTAVQLKLDYALWSQNESDFNRHMNDLECLIKAGCDLNKQMEGQTVLDTLVERSISPKQVMLGHNVSRYHANASKAYDILRNMGAKTGAEL